MRELKPINRSEWQAVALCILAVLAVVAAGIYGCEREGELIAACNGDVAFCNALAKQRP